MSRNHSRILLVEQHGRLRELLVLAQVAAERFHADGNTASELRVALEGLRIVLDEHNRTEESLLMPIFQEDAIIGGQRQAERMLYEHASEHAMFRAGLDGEDAEVAKRLPRVAEGLVAHMDAEERTFLSPVALREPEPFVWPDRKPVPRAG